MLWLTTSIAVLIGGLIVVYLALPLWQARNDLLIDDDHPLAALLQRKNDALLAIKELEFDFHTGKLSGEDYERINGRLRQQATNILRQLEQIAPATAGLDDELEALISKRRRAKA